MRYAMRAIIFPAIPDRAKQRVRDDSTRPKAREIT
jgi:hypothetical protein